MRGQDAGSFRPINLCAFKVHEFAESTAEAVSRIRKGVAFDPCFHAQVEMREADRVDVDVMLGAALAIGPAVAVFRWITCLQGAEIRFGSSCMPRLISPGNRYVPARSHRRN